MRSASWPRGTSPRAVSSISVVSAKLNGNRVRYVGRRRDTGPGASYDQRDSAASNGGLNGGPANWPVLLFGYGDLMGGFFNFLTTIATNGRGRRFDTFLTLTSHYSRISMKTLEELTPGGCRWPVADLCTAGDRPGSKTRFCGEAVEERSVGTQLCPYCATHAAMAYIRVGHQSINDRAKAHRKIVSVPIVD